MPAMPADTSLSRLELVALARMATTKPSSATALLKSLHSFSLTEVAKSDVERTLQGLTSRNLLDEKLRLTPAGHRAVQMGLGVPATPTWLDTRTLLARLIGMPSASEVAATADELIADALGVPRQRFTIASLRELVISKKTGIAPAPSGKRAEARRTAVGQWIDTPGPVGQPPPPTPVPPPPPPPRDLLAVVREAMLRVPSAGRFGEKVFVSALWQDLQVADLPLDKFKHWLVGANRDGQIVLARADLPSAMNPKLVAASEIRDQGATFHFVLDAQPTNGRTTHAR